MQRRIVFEYTTGRFAGLRQIQGALAPPTVTSPLSIQVESRTIRMQLTRVTPTHVLYREDASHETDMQRVSPEEGTTPTSPVA